MNLERALDEGQIDDEEFARQEEALLHRMEEIRAYHLRQGGQSPGL